MKGTVAAALALLVYAGLTGAAAARQPLSGLEAAPGICDVFPYLPGCH